MISTGNTIPSEAMTDSSSSMEAMTSSSSSREAVVRGPWALPEPATPDLSMTKTWRKVLRVSQLEGVILNLSSPAEKTVPTSGRFNKCVIFVYL